VRMINNGIDDAWISIATPEDQRSHHMCDGQRSDR
jgi:hypothetical protein